MLRDRRHRDEEDAAIRQDFQIDKFTGADAGPGRYRDTPMFIGLPEHVHRLCFAAALQRQWRS